MIFYYTLFDKKSIKNQFMLLGAFALFFANPWITFCFCG